MTVWYIQGENHPYRWQQQELFIYYRIYLMRCRICSQELDTAAAEQQEQRGGTPHPGHGAVTLEISGQWSLGTRTSPWLGQPWSSLHRRVSMGNEKQHSNDSQTERPPNFQSNVCVDKCWDMSYVTHVKLMLKSNVLTERITWETLTHDKTRLKVCRRKSFQIELLRSLQCQNWFSIFMVVLIAWKCVLQSCKN